MRLDAPCRQDPSLSKAWSGDPISRRFAPRASIFGRSQTQRRIPRIVGFRTAFSTLRFETTGDCLVWSCLVKQQLTALGVLLPRPRNTGAPQCRVRRQGGFHGQGNCLRGSACEEVDQAAAHGQTEVCTAARNGFRLEDRALPQVVSERPCLGRGRRNPGPERPKLGLGSTNFGPHVGCGRASLTPVGHVLAPSDRRWVATEAFSRPTHVWVGQCGTRVVHIWAPIDQ